MIYQITIILLIKYNEWIIDSIDIHINISYKLDHTNQ